MANISSQAVGPGVKNVVLRQARNGKKESFVACLELNIFSEMPKSRTFHHATIIGKSTALYGRTDVAMSK